MHHLLFFPTRPSFILSPSSTLIRLLYEPVKILILASSAAHVTAIWMLLTVTTEAAVIVPAKHTHSVAFGQQHIHAPFIIRRKPERNLHRNSRILCVFLLWIINGCGSVSASSLISAWCSELVFTIAPVHSQFYSFSSMSSLNFLELPLHAS